MHSFERERGGNSERGAVPSQAGRQPAGMNSAWLRHLQRVAAGAQAPAAGPSIQRTLRSTREEMEVTRSQSALKRYTDMFRAQGNAAKAAELEKKLDEAAPLPMAGTVAFANEMVVQERKNSRYRLTVDLTTLECSVARRLDRKRYGPEKKADGTYNFVIPVRGPEKPQKIVASPEGAIQEGHSALAKAGAGRPGYVYWAGTATFDDGVLKNWTNDSGHYKPTGEDAPQVAGFTGGAFSMDKYRDHAAG